MSAELDFSDLSDDQIVELATALAREAMRRNPALKAAFAQSLIDERQRVEAAARGAEAAKRAEADRIAKQAHEAEARQARERERQRVQSGLAAYLRACAVLVEKNVQDLTLVWEPNDHSRGHNHGTQRLKINLGNIGRHASWHLIDYFGSTQQIYTSPGLRSRHAQLLPWCREVSAAAQALGINKTMIIHGAEL